MLIRTPTELGALIRSRRKQLNWDQALLAQRAGVSRRWIGEVENGKPGASVELLLRTLKVLGLELDVKVLREETLNAQEQLSNLLNKARGTDDD